MPSPLIPALPFETPWLTPFGLAHREIIQKELELELHAFTAASTSDRDRLVEFFFWSAIAYIHQCFCNHCIEAKDVIHAQLLPHGCHASRCVLKCSSAGLRSGTEGTHQDLVELCAVWAAERYQAIYGRQPLPPAGEPVSDVISLEY